MFYGSDIIFVVRDYGWGSGCGWIKWEIVVLRMFGCFRFLIVGIEWIVVIILKIKSFFVLRVECVLSV